MTGFPSRLDFKFVLICFFALVFLVVSCDPTDNKLKVLNTAEFPIFCLYSFNENLSLLDSTVVEPYSGEGIKVNETYSLRGYLLDWEAAINRESTDKKVRIYIFSEDSVKKYSWKNLIEEKKHNKKYVLSIPDLKQLDWIVEFRN